MDFIYCFSITRKFIIFTEIMFSALTESQPYFLTGFIFGASYIVAPSTCQELDDTGNTEQNTQGTVLIILVGAASRFISLFTGLLIFLFGYYFIRHFHVQFSFEFSWNIFFFYLVKSAVFQVLCHVLNSLDQGLVCFSNCNVETMSETSFRCFYVLLPSDKGMMLLRVTFEPHVL